MPNHRLSNGHIDEGEQCDYAIPEEFACCNASCMGCLCGNGVLDAGEQCDPAIPSNADCCNGTCIGCAARSKANTALIASVTTVGALVAIALVAALAMLVRQQAAAGVAAGTGPDAAYSGMNDNPLFAKRDSNLNPLYDNAL